MDGSSNISSCSICLETIKAKAKAYGGSCLHEFCFNCIRDWIKLKPECPLCKEPIKTIIHSVVSNDNYQEMTVKELLETPLESYERIMGRLSQLGIILSENRRSGPNNSEQSQQVDQQVD